MTNRLRTGTSPFSMGKSTISTGSWLPVRYVSQSVPEGTRFQMIDGGKPEGTSKGRLPMMIENAYGCNKFKSPTDAKCSPSDSTFQSRGAIKKSTSAFERIGMPHFTKQYTFWFVAWKGISGCGRQHLVLLPWHEQYWDCWCLSFSYRLVFYSSQLYIIAHHYTSWKK